MSDTHTNDESVSSGSEKLYYVSAECSELHDGRELLNRIYSINIDDLFNLIFTKSEFMLEFLKSRNFENIEIGDWLDKTTILKNDQQASSSRNPNTESSQIISPKPLETSNTESSQIISPKPLETSNTKSSQIISPKPLETSNTKNSSQSSIKRNSKLFLSKATQTRNDIYESSSEEDTKNDPLIGRSSLILKNKDNAKEDIENDLVIVKSSVNLNNENKKENSIKKSNKEKNIKKEQNRKKSSSEDDENSNIKKTKTLKYTVNSSVGSNVRVTNELILLKCSIPNELYSVNELSSSKGILYADTFIINVHYCLVRVSEEKTKFLVYGNVKFIKNLISFTRGIIESQVWNGLNDYYKQLHIKLQDISSPKPLKHQTFSFSSIQRKRFKKRSFRLRTPDSSYETADDEPGSSSMMGISRSINAIKNKLIKLKRTKNYSNTDTSEDNDEILVNENENNNDDDYFRNIWNDYFTANTGLGILIAIGLIIYFLRR